MDVRTKQGGVVKTVLVKAGDTVNIGQELLVIDTEGQPSAEAAAPAAAGAGAAPAAASAPAPATTTAAASHHRVPSIKFRYGKRDAAEQQQHPKPAAAATAPAKAAAGAPAASAGSFDSVKYAGDYNAFLDSILPSKAKGASYLDLPAKYARPAWSEAEMEAVTTGGATAAQPFPEAKKEKKAAK